LFQSKNITKSIIVSIPNAINVRTKITLFTLILSSLLATFALEVHSQAIDQQLWFDYILTIPGKNKFSYGGDVGIRGFYSNADWNQFYFRPTVRYRFNPIVGISGSLATFNTFNQINLDVHEFRITQDLNISWPDLNVLSLFYRVRLEQRFFFYEGGGNSQKLRGRLLLGAETRNFKWFSDKRSFFFQASWEGFQNPGSESAYEIFINQVRMDAAFGHRLSKNIRYELHYIWQRSRLFSDSGLQTTQNIIRLRFYHKLVKKK